MATQLKLFTPPGVQRFDCSGCGDCCRGRFGIPVSNADRERIEAQGWTDEDLGLAGKPLFTVRGDETQLAHRTDGSCVFLQDDARCRIHSKFGADAKPAGCRLYPFKLIPIGSQVRVDVRFDCPSIAANLGNLIPTYREELQKLLKTIAAERDEALPIPTLYGRQEMTWAKLCRITETFERVLWDVSLDLTRRITACVNLAAVLRSPRISGLELKALGDFLDEVASGVQQTAAGDDLRRHSPNPVERAIFRQTINIHSRYDHVGDRETLLSRMRTSMRMLGGKGLVPLLRAGFPRVAFSDMESASGIPSSEAAGALERYLHIHLTSMGFFGPAYYQRSYLDGINALLLTYPLVCWFARVYAAEGGMAAPDDSCVKRALMIVDHQHGVARAMDMQGERSSNSFLHERATLRAFVIWYGS